MGKAGIVKEIQDACGSDLTHVCYFLMRAGGRCAIATLVAHRIIPALAYIASHMQIAVSVTLRTGNPKAVLDTRDIAAAETILAAQNYR